MRRIMFASVTVVVVLGLALAASAVVGPPEVDKANATATSNNTPGTKRSLSCPGEDNGAANAFTSYQMKWPATEVDATPGSTDYNLSGDLTVNGKITVNNQTQRGVLIGTATLVSAPTTGAGTKQYAGPITVVLQQIDTPAGLRWVGRGLINATAFLIPAGATTPVADGKLIANIEMQFSAGAKGPFDFFAASFGDSAPAIASAPIADYSVGFNAKTCL